MSSSTLRSQSWKSHPIYHIRLALLIVNTISILLALVTLPAYMPISIFVAIVVILLSAPSLGFVLWDLIKYSHQQQSLLPQYACRDPSQSDYDTRVVDDGNHDNDDDDDDDDDGDGDSDKPQWPRLSLIVWDAIFAFLFHWAFWLTIGSMAPPYGYLVGLVVLKAYSSLAILAACLLHAWAFWRELMARKHQSWRREQLRARRRRVCQRCGARTRPAAPLASSSAPQDETAAAVVRGLNDSVKQRLAQLLRKGSGAELGGEEVEETTEEDSLLLATPDGSGAETQKGYGGVEDGPSAMEAPEERVVKKKGKGRMIDA